MASTATGNFAIRTLNLKPSDAMGFQLVSEREPQLPVGLNVVAIVQARMGSTRLPGKVLMDIDGKPMLTRVVERLGETSLICNVVVATSVDAGDDVLETFCEEQSIHCVRGSQDDVLDRYKQAAEQYQADVIVRVSSDCPLIDPGVSDRVVSEFVARYPDIDYAGSFYLRRTFPLGLDTEVFSYSALERAWRESTDESSREHVTPFIYRNPQAFRLHPVLNAVDESQKRWTVDTNDDLQLIRSIYGHFAGQRFTWQDVLQAYAQHSEWNHINTHVQQKAA